MGLNLENNMKNNERIVLFLTLPSFVVYFKENFTVHAAKLCLNVQEVSYSL